MHTPVLVDPSKLPERTQGFTAFMAIDRVNKNFHFILLSQQKMETVPYSMIQSSEVVVDSDSIIKTDRAGQIGGAIIGGVLTGGIGALVLAMGAKKKAIEKINKVELKVLVKGSPEPMKIFDFSEGLFMKASKKSVEEATKWHDIISGAIAEANVMAIDNSFSQSSQFSVADELTKLVELRTKGLLTDLEFLNAKNNLLRG